MAKNPRMMSKTGSNTRGFTLIEVMLAVCVLALGVVMVQQGLLRSADLVARASTRLKARFLLEEKLWQTRETLVFADAPESADDGGSGGDAMSSYQWDVGSSATGDTEDLYSVKGKIIWKESGRDVEFENETFVTLRKMEL